jgi:hypothetical protein
MAESVPALADVLEVVMTSTDLLDATKASADLVEAILNLVDMGEVIQSSTNPEEAGSNLYTLPPEPHLVQQKSP